MGSPAVSLGGYGLQASVVSGADEAAFVAGERIKIWAEKARGGEMDGIERSDLATWFIYGRVDVVVDSDVRKSEQQFAGVWQQDGHRSRDRPGKFDAEQIRAAHSASARLS